jgi:AcrR family transcriptional regulator
VGVTTFQRARSDEQRAARSQAILDTAAAMLTEMPVAQLTLNELSRRVGLAKSNVLRYFESREAVLLELLHTNVRSWIGTLRTELQRSIDPAASVTDRCEQLATTFATTLTQHPLLCDLISAQAAVLERNVSTEAVLKFKQTSHADLAELIGLLVEHLPELGEQDAERFAVHTIILLGALWTYANPNEAVKCAYDSEPELADMQVDFTETLADMSAVVLAGIFARR